MCGHQKILLTKKFHVINVGSNINSIKVDDSDKLVSVEFARDLITWLLTFTMVNA